MLKAERRWNTENNTSPKRTFEVRNVPEGTLGLPASGFLAGVVLLVAGTNTTSHQPSFAYQELGAHLTPNDNAKSASARDAIKEIRSLTALTWEHLAIILQVNRRALHYWAAGRPTSADNVAKVEDLRKVVADLGDIPNYERRAKLIDMYQLKPIRPTRARRSEPFLEADHTPTGFTHEFLLTPKTRIVRGG